MADTIIYIPYAATGSFSPLVIDYLAGNDKIRPYYKFPFSKNGINEAIAERQKFPTDRQNLYNVLKKRYFGYTHTNLVADNIEKLREHTTFTVCTAHQPNLMTGYLYFIYKIVHAIKLADELNATHPDLHFVPVYYMGSEDNDLDELGTFRFRGTKFRWDGNGQQGAVGRMATDSLKPMLEELLSLLGPPGPACDLLADLIKNAYLQHPTIASATFYLVNELFGQFGLIIVDPDDADLKRAFLPVMEDELLHQSAYPIVTEQIAQLGKEYKIQANPRDINLFYLSGQVRERIERKGATWHVLNTEISWTEDEVIAELRNHPERFSPNVVLRALFQETILPDVAFIGGGAEVAYWLQLKTLFERFNVYYPAIVLRQSVQLLNNDAEKLMRTLNLTYDDLFKNADELCKQQVLKSYSGKLLLDTEKEQLSSLFDEIARKASIIDPTLKAATAAVAARNEKQVARLEKKLLNAAKKQESVLVNRIHKLKSTLFPGGGLQERTENFAEPFLEKGHLFTESLYNAIEPFRNELLILKME